jgi:hypothetical protein
LSGPKPPGTVSTVFDAEYHYEFWRPITAIRKGDIDGKLATDQEATSDTLIGLPIGTIEGLISNHCF